MIVRNLLRPLPARLPEEDVAILLAHPGVRIERIVSTGQASPPGFWYDQDHDEWVLLLAGAAGLLVEGEPELTLRPGDCLLIRAGKRHRVTWTQSAEPTVWLAIHLTDAAPAS